MKRKTDKAEADPRRSLDIASAGEGLRDGESLQQAQARVMAQGTPMNAALVLDATAQRFPDADLTSMVGALWKHSKATAQGDLAGTERMLAEQSMALNALWCELARMGLLNINAGHLGSGEVMLRLGLKAQAQATRAAEALATLKHGPLVYARQANIANGPQQVVNNHAAVENRIPPTELAEQAHELHQNPGTPRLDGPASAPLEALGTLHRAAHRAGQGHQQPKRIQRRAPAGDA